ncbi:metallophosphoesterase [Sphingobacterium sp. N143]|uniref:metallophosphoesterase n=1 Tax=Sphingobacterium sp. N143 TaxID=2746727 RepID=UPI00336AC40A
MQSHNNINLILKAPFLFCGVMQSHKRTWKYFTLILLSCLCHLTNQAQQNRSTLRIGLMADMQYADKADRGTRFYRNSLQKVDTAVRFFNQQKVNFNVILGDLVDEGPKDFSQLNRYLINLNKPLYCLLGNHDYVNVTEPDQLHKIYNMPNSYYSFSKGEWRFIFLNTNELSEYATQEGSPLRHQWELLVDSLQKSDRRNTQPWNGGLSHTQLNWLKIELSQAEKNKEKVILFTHHPLLPENGYEALNNNKVVEVINKSHAVKMVLSGHNHKGGSAVLANVPYITLEGMIETPQENAYGVLELYPNEIKIIGIGRLQTRVFKITSP